MLDAGERNVAPARENVGAEDRLVQRLCRGLEVDLADEPLLGQFADRLSGAHRIDVSACLHGRCHTVEPRLRIDPPREMAGVFLAGAVAVPRSPRAVGTLLDVGHVIT